MKKRLLKILTLVLLTWPTPWLHAQETSYTIQDFEGEYGLAFITMESVDVDQRVPIESNNPQEILDQLLKIIIDQRMDPITSSSFSGGYNNLKENFETNYVIKDGRFISSGDTAGLVIEKIVKANQPTPFPLLETKPLSFLTDVGYIVLDKYDLYHIGIADFKEEGQTFDIHVLRKKDQPILNDQIDQPLYNSLLPEGVNFDEYGYQTIPYDQLGTNENGDDYKELTVTGKITKILQLESFSYKFIIEAGDGNEPYYVKWNSDPNLDIHEGDIVYIRGTYHGREMVYETQQEYPYILVSSSMSDTVEKVD